MFSYFVTTRQNPSRVFEVWERGTFGRLGRAPFWKRRMFEWTNGDVFLWWLILFSTKDFGCFFWLCRNCWDEVGLVLCFCWFGGNAWSSFLQHFSDVLNGGTLSLFGDEKPYWRGSFYQSLLDLFLVNLTTAACYIECLTSLCLDIESRNSIFRCSCRWSTCSILRSCTNLYPWINELLISRWVD